MLSRLQFFCLTVVLLVASMQLAAQEPTAEQLQFFEQKVRPLLVAKCFECHSSSAEKVQGGLTLDSRDSLLTGGDNGPAVVAGKPNESLLVKAIHYAESGLEMPPSGKLKPHEIELLETWVALGVPYPASQSSTKQRKSIDIEAGKQHWAFRPLNDQCELPIDPWSRNRVDSFIYALSSLTINVRSKWHPNRN